MLSAPSAPLAKTFSTITAAALIAGNLVVAGILGLPINTGLAGLWPSLLAMVAGGAMIFLTASILGQQALATLAFAIPLIILTCINLSLIQRLNTVLVLVLTGTFALLVIMGAGMWNRNGWVTWIGLFYQQLCRSSPPPSTSTTSFPRSAPT